MPITKDELDALFSIIGQRIELRVSAVRAEIEKIIQSMPAPERGPQGERGEKGESGLDAVIDYESIVTEAVKQIPLPKDGRDGIDGKDADPVDVDAIIAEILKRVPDVDYDKIVRDIVNQIPLPKDGKQGPQGERGEKGESVNVADVIAGVLAQIPKPADGKDGKDGKDGIDGQDGRDGKDGVDGVNGIDGKDADPVDADAIIEEVVKRIPTPKDGADGINGKDGINGIDGAKGDKGDRGEHGKDGRDALQLDILPAIDLDKSYPRGTFSRFDGGLIRAYRDTIPGESFDRAGWEVIVAGVADIGVLLSEDGRTVTVETRKTGDEVIRQKFSIPAVIYRGIFRSQDEYQRGDVVTWGGSAWHSQTDANKSEPGRNDDWKLMVKEGRKGKDGQPGERGPQGFPGRPGANLINE